MYQLEERIDGFAGAFEAPAAVFFSLLSR